MPPSMLENLFTELGTCIGSGIATIVSGVAMDTLYLQEDYDKRQHYTYFHDEAVWSGCVHLPQWQ